MRVYYSTIKWNPNEGTKVTKGKKKLREKRKTERQLQIELKGGAHNPDNKIMKMSKPYITSQTRENWNIIFYVSTNSIQPQVKILNEIQSYSVNTT